MSLIVLYLGTKYDVCECNSLRHMTISSFFVTFDPRLWPSSSVKVTFIFIIWWTLYCCVLVPSTKFVGSIEFEIYGQLFGENLNDVTMTSSPIHFLWNFNTTRPRVYLSDIPNFILIEIRELRYEVGKLTENYEEKTVITSPWSWPLTQGHQFQ